MANLTAGVPFQISGGSASANKFVSAITPAGSVTLSQPAAANLSDGTTGTGTVVESISPALTGTPTAPTSTGYTNSTQIATTAYVDKTILGFGNANWHEDFLTFFGS